MMPGSLTFKDLDSNSVVTLTGTYTVHTEMHGQPQPDGTVKDVPVAVGRVHFEFSRTKFTVGMGEAGTIQSALITLLQEANQAVLDAQAAIDHPHHSSEAASG